MAEPKNENVDPPQDVEQTPDTAEALVGTGNLSKVGLDNSSTGTPGRRYEFKNGYGAKVWAGDVEGEFRVAALTPDGRVSRHLDGIPRLPASLPVDDVNEILATLDAIS